jgi:carbonic anhydrase
MSTPVQQNLVSKNAEYSASFTKGDLALAPAKKYLVGMEFITALDSLSANV